MHAFILAGGFATRLWPLTNDRAKPLLPLAGKPIINYLVEDIPINIPVTVSTNAAFEEGFTLWAETMERDNIHVVIERTKSDDEKLGALGALAQWIETENIEDDLLILTGDNYLGFSIAEFIDKQQSSIAQLAAFDIEDLEQAKSFGTVIVESDNRSICMFEEKPKNPQSTLVNTGCSVLPKETLPVLLEHAKKHPDDLGGIFEELLKRGITVHCFQFQGLWFDIGSFDAYLEATQAIIGEQTQKSESAQCRASECSGSVVLAEGCTIKDSELKNVVLFPHCTVEDCTLEDCIIDEHSTLKGIDLSGKMLQAHSRLVVE